LIKDLKKQEVKAQEEAKYDELLNKINSENNENADYDQFINNLN
jgi:hypothetical protein